MSHNMMWTVNRRKHLAFSCPQGTVLEEPQDILHANSFWHIFFETQWYINSSCLLLRSPFWMRSTVILFHTAERSLKCGNCLLSGSVPIFPFHPEGHWQETPGGEGSWKAGEWLWEGVLFRARKAQVPRQKVKVTREADPMALVCCASWGFWDWFEGGA